MYMVYRLLVDLGWVDYDRVFHILALPLLQNAPQPRQNRE